MPQRAAITPKDSLARLILLGFAALSCGLQLIMLYRPSGPPTPEAIPHLDKVGHLVIFAVPVVLIMVFRAVSSGARPTVRFATVLIGLFGGHAVLSEAVQSALLPRRSGDPVDIVADLVGIAIGYGTAVLIINRRQEI